MAFLGICDARCQSFYTEMLEKENALRIKWFLKNQQRLLDHLAKAKLAAPSKIVPVRQDEVQKKTHTDVYLKPLPAWRPMNADGTININLMKPIDRQVRDVLFEKSVPTFLTAENYIRKRVKENPEDRYYFPECTSWVYGWHLKDYPPVPQSKVRMNSIMLNEFYHPTAFNLQRDPEWCRPLQRNVKNFDDLIC